MKRVLAGLGLTLVFTIALVLGVLLHLDTPIARRFAVARVNEALADSFGGTITIEGIERLGNEGVHGAAVTIRDPSGRPIIVASGVHARTDARAIVRSALGSGPIAIAIEQAVVEKADVVLDTDDEGELLLAKTFAPRHPSPAGPPGRGVHLVIEKIQVAEATAKGSPAKGFPIDGTAKAIQGRLEVASGKVTLAVRRADLVTRGMLGGLDPAGAGRVMVDAPSASGAGVAIHAGLDGTVATMPIVASFALDGKKLDATAAIDHVDPAKLHAVFPDVPLEEDATLLAEAHGVLPHLDVTVNSVLRPSRGLVDVEAAIDLDKGPSIVATAYVSHLDARALVAKAPATSVEAVVRATVVLGGEPHGDFGIELRPSTVAGQRIPKGTASGTFQGKSVTGKLHLDEEGAPIDATFALAGDQLTVDATAKVARLERIARAGTGIKGTSGSANVRAHATIGLRDKTIDGTADADLADVGRGDLHVARGTLHARVRGALDHPDLDAQLDATDVDGIDGERFPKARVTARGKPESPHVEAWLGGEPGRELTASADVDVASVTLHKASATIERGRTHVVAKAAAVKLGGGEVRVDDAVVEGLGAPARASVRATKQETRILLVAKHVPLGRLARLVHLEKEVQHGIADIDVDLVIDKKGAHGHVELDVDKATLAGVKDVAASVRAQLADRRVEATVHAAVADVGTLDLATKDFELGGEGPVDLNAWRKGYGRADVDARVDLAKLHDLFGKDAWGLSELAGVLVLHASAARDSQTDMTPALTLEAHTEGLAALQTNGTRIAGVDPTLDVAIDGDTGAARVVARGVDASGTFVTLDARSEQIPYKDVFAGVAKLDRIPFKAQLVLPSRPIASLPLGLALAATKGDIVGSLDFEGTVREPKVTATTTLRGITGDGAALTLPIDLELDARYDGRSIELESQARTRRAALANAAAQVDLKIDDVLDGKPLDWRARGVVQLAKFPLWRVAPLADRGIRGTASGQLTVTGVHTKWARASAQLAIADLELGTLKYSGATLRASAKNGVLEADAKVDQTDGTLEAHATAGLRFEGGVVPTVDPSVPLDAAIVAKNVRASGFHPLVDEALTELDGRVDGKATFHLEHGQPPRLEGELTLADGVVGVTSTGTQLHDVRAKVTMTQAGLVHIQDVSAKGISGSLTASADLQLDGLRLASANGKLEIPQKSPIPLGFQGVQMGDVSGRFQMKANALPDKKELDLELDAEAVRVNMPLSSAHAVRELDQRADIKVGVVRGGSFRSVPLGEPKADAAAYDGSVMIAKVHLHDVEVVRGSSLRASLEGDLAARMAAGTTVTGQVRLPRGTLEVQGKKFEIEKGTITWTGDPANPLAVVTAAWPAPDGTRIYADYTGPLRTGKVTLRSEPPRPQSEILAVILFGSAEGSATTPYAQQGGGAANTAGAAAGGVAAEGLAQGIDQLTGVDVSAKIDTSNSANPRPEVEVQIARGISLQVSTILGTPPPGTNPDKNFATIDWRFLRLWSLQTTFGDQGSTFADVVWQYRY